MFNVRRYYSLKRNVLLNQLGVLSFNFQLGVKRFVELKMKALSQSVNKQTYAKVLKPLMSSLIIGLSVPFE